MFPGKQDSFPSSPSKHHVVVKKLCPSPWPGNEKESLVWTCSPVREESDRIALH